MLSANSDTFKSSLPIWVSLLSFSFCLISLTRTNTAGLKRSGESGYPCLVSGIFVLFLNIARSPSFSPLWYWLWVCHKWPLLCWDMCPLYQLLKITSLLMVSLGLRYCVWAFSSCEQGLLSSCSTWASPCDGFSLCRAWALGPVGFSSCSSWALEHRLNVVVPGLSCAMACGIFLDQRLNQCL